MKKNSFRARVSYFIDRLMSRGTTAMIGLLFGITVIVALIVAVLAHLLSPHQAGSFADSLWGSWMRILDAGNVTGDYETHQAGYIVLMVLATICGLFVTSILIGIINTAFQQRLEALRQGNSRVLEKGHTVILGEDEHLTSVVHELLLAGESASKSAIVILCEHDRVDLEAQLAQQSYPGKKARVICRQGEPTSFPALDNIALEDCARVIALGKNDFEVIKEILAAATMLTQRQAPESVTISAVITDPQNVAAARIAGGTRLELLHFKRLIARIIAQTCRQAGLSQVYQELFDFGGDEIYIENAPALTGLPLREIVLRYADASVMGILRGGQTLLNPQEDTVLEAGDQLILIESDAGAAVPMSAPGAVEEACIALREPPPEAPETLLMLGRNQLADDVAAELSQSVAPDSVLTLAAEGLTEGMRQIGNLSVRSLSRDIHSQQALSDLLSEKPQCVIVLSEDDEPDPDARTLTLLLHMTQHYREHPESVVIVSQMLHQKNQALASVAQVNDFVIGTNLASLVLSQVSKNRWLNPMFDELLTDDGAEIYIRPISLFVKTGVSMSLFTLVAATARAGQLLLGLRVRRKDGRFEVVVNPHKETPWIFGDADCAIVLAND